MQQLWLVVVWLLLLPKAEGWLEELYHLFVQVGDAFLEFLL
jgi:hypothetical protein